MTEHPEGLTAEQWIEALDRISQNLKGSARLCLMGSATNLIEGMAGRMSIDLDVWRRMSKFDESTLRPAVEAAGLMYNPRGFEEPNRPYIQIIDPGVAHVGEFSETTDLLPNDGALQVVRPPIENIIASKMVRMSAKDFDDIKFLLEKHPETTKADVEQAVSTLPKKHAQIAEENLVYIDMLSPPKKMAPSVDFD